MQVKILQVKKQKNKYKVITESDDFLMDEDTIIKYHIFNDTCFTIEEFNKILADVDENKFFNKVLNYISYSLRSEYEIDKYLNDCKYKTHIIKRLKELGYINDDLLAKEYYNYCLNNNKGPNFYKYNLISKKVKDSIIDEYLQNYSNELQKEKAYLIINKMNNSSYPLRKQKAKIQEKLIRDGFDFSIVYEIIDGIELVDNSKNELDKLVNKLMIKYSSLNEYERNNKIINSLMQKGYEYREIRELLK